MTERHSNNEECRTMLYSSQTSFESTQMILAETVNIHNTAFDAHIGSNAGSHTLHSIHQNIPEPSAEDDDVEDDDEVYCRAQSDSEDLKQLTGIEEPSTSETCLQVLRKQDKDQAKALILEGRVQMLVVQREDNMYRCSHCSYVTRKQAALIRHTKTSCQVMKTGLHCQDCGMHFKQQRSLNTHRLRKCRSLLSGRKKSDFTNATEKSGSLVGHPGSMNPKSETPTIQTESLEVTDSRLQDSAEPQGSLSPIITDVINETDSLTSTCEEGQATIRSINKLAEVERSTNDQTSGYTEEGGRFTCRKCSFSTVRKVTIDRHCATCSRSAPKIYLAEMAGQFEQEDNLSDSDQEDQDVDGANDSEGDSAEQERSPTSKPQFSCPNCPFLCHQKRALASHELKGCLKRGEIQCPHCSFVAKSDKSLSHHILSHKKDKNAIKEKRSGNLQCDLCSFTCKQERCLTQHVAVKHKGVRPHQCRFCSFSTVRRYRLEAHESMHTGVGRHSCELCGQTFGTTSRLRLHHQRIHDKQATHFCSVCDYRAYNLNDIKRHNLSCHTGELRYHCSQCDARFSSDGALKQHCHRVHSDANSLSCTQCSFTCRGQAALKTHVQSDHSEKTSDLQDSPEKRSKKSITHKCTVCSFKTNKRLLLVQHMLDEHEDGPAEEKTLKCDVCGFSCTHQVVFDQHIRSHGGTCLFKCTECEFSTRNKQKITWHIRIHTGEKPYRCEKCNYACADPSRLKYHMRIHMDERKYLCPECGYKCKWVNQLKYHMTKHTGSKPYACEDCEYRTNRADALRIHRETRHRDVRSFICEKCGKAFKTRFLLKTHQRKHSEARPYVCSVCQKAFRWPAGLRHHYLSHTNQLPFYCLHCPYRAKQKFQVVKHLHRHHPDLPVQNSVGKSQEASSTGTQKTWNGEEEERREDGQTALEHTQSAGDM